MNTAGAIGFFAFIFSICTLAITAVLARIATALETMANKDNPTS
jgi:hypothetical protein